MTTPDLRGLLRAQLREAIRMRDKRATSVLRTTLAAIDNAEAVPTEQSRAAGAMENSALGVGATDVARRELTPSDTHDIVRAEIDERSRAASAIASTHPGRAAELLEECQVLTIVLSRAGY